MTVTRGCALTEWGTGLSGVGFGLGEGRKHDVRRDGRGSWMSMYGERKCWGDLWEGRRELYPAPRGLTAQSSMSSGSDHMRSQKLPSCGISWFLSINRIWSTVTMSGERPPCTHKILSSITAATLR